jgi:hypothetical protein
MSKWTLLCDKWCQNELYCVISDVKMNYSVMIIIWYYVFMVINGHCAGEQ